MNARTTAARLLVSVAVACAGSFLLGGVASAEEPTTVQNGNDSANSTATSAPVTAGNSTTVGSGPQARDGGSASMVGNTNTTVEQNNNASSGPVTAGSQVSRPQSGATEQNHNSSYGATATGDPVTSYNTVDAHNGPYASGDGANASMVGDGNLDISQDAQAHGGPATSGSQITDSGSDSIVQNSNNCGDAVSEISCGTATAGGVDVSNVFGDSTDALLPVPSGTGPVAYSTSGDAVTSSLVGDADAVITQSATGASGGATNGSQVSDVAGATAQNTNEASNGDATSGPVTAANLGIAFVGPLAAGSAPASASQVGDASGDLDMSATGASGNAVTGSQITGAIGDAAGALTVQNRSASEDDTATTGAANAGSTVYANAGPYAATEDGTASAVLVGDASFDVVTVADALSGDAHSGAQYTDATDESTVQNDNDSLGNTAISGDACSSPICEGGNLITIGAGPVAFGIGADATSGQVGDASAELNADASSVSGDAVAGSQDATASGDSVVQDSNLSTGNNATSGLAFSSNDILANSGPFAAGGTSAANASLVGDSDLELDAGSIASSGDAISGSQVAEASDSAVVQDSNEASYDESISGAALSGNFATVIAGPDAGYDVVTDEITGGSAAQVGDADVQLELTSGAFTGDAVSGVQDSTASDDSVVQNDAVSEFSYAYSGPACAHPACGGEITNEADDTAFVPGGNIVTLVGGPSAFGDGTATSSLAGDVHVDYGQSALASTGDAISGSQGTNATGDSVVQNSNDSASDVAGCQTLEGCGAVAGNVTNALVGPNATAAAGFAADAVQSGDVRLSGDQDTVATTGDAAAGSQTSDVNDSTIQANNESFDSVATAGPAVAFSGIGTDPFAGSDEPVVIGASADAVAADASAAQVGDDRLDVGVTVSSSSGDAIAGSQLVDLDGVDAGQVDNTATSSFALSGPAQGFSLLNGNVGPNAVDGDVVLVGDVRFTFNDNVETSTGDSIAGSQLIGNSGTVVILGDGEASTASISSAHNGTTFGSDGSDGGVNWQHGGLIGDSVAHSGL